MSRLGFIESRRLNRVETPHELHQQIGRTLTHGWTMDSLDYEHRYITTHYPTRLCPACREIARLQVVINTDTNTRTRCCPECDAILTDQHTRPERLETAIEGRGLPKGIGLQATPGGDDA